jgi:hypothetical protein
MWLVRTLAAADPDEFAVSVRPPSLKILVSERGRFDASATLIDFGKVRALRAAERLARTGSNVGIGSKARLRAGVRPRDRLPRGRRHGASEVNACGSGTFGG